MFDFVLIRNEEKVFEGKVLEVSSKTENGPITFLPQHEPYMARIVEKVSYISENKEEKTQDITDGFIYTNGSICFAVVDKIN